MKIFIHTGYPKAASTTLQKHLFNKHPEINNLGIYPRGNIGIDSDEVDESAVYLNNPALKKFYDNIVNLDTLNYSFCMNNQVFKNQISNLLDSDKVNVFSNERFLTPFFCYSDIGVKAQRVYEILGGVKVIIIIRNQIELIRSQYADWPYDPRAFTMRRPADISDWINIDLAAVDSRNFIKSLNYFMVLKYYGALFGKDNVKVLLFEKLRDNLEEFSKEISDFMGIDNSDTINILQNKHENKARKKDVREKNIEPGLENKLNGFFAKINREVVSQFNLELERYGYPL